MTNTRQFLDYVGSQEEAILTYSASDMILAAHSDASYLSEPEARSRAGGHIFLSNDVEYPPNNGSILTIAQVIKRVMSSATEAEMAALFLVAKECVYIRLVLEEMGHKQPATPIHCDNSTAVGIANNTVKKQRSRSMEMRFFGLQIKSSKNCSKYCGTQEQKILQIISQNILMLNITLM